MHINELLSRPNKRYELQNADFTVAEYNTVKYGKNSVRYYEPYIWSKLDIENKEDPSLESFKGNIRNIGS